MSLRELERDGWVLECPFCGNAIFYTLIHNQRLPVPFFYAEQGNDVLLRKEDERRVEGILMRYGNAKPPIHELETLWISFLQTAPMAPGGGCFGLWANVKCPHCKKEIPYNGGVRNLDLRIYEPKIVLVDGAILLGDSLEESWRIKVRLAK